LLKDKQTDCTRLHKTTPAPFPVFPDGPFDGCAGGGHGTVSRFAFTGILAQYALRYNKLTDLRMKRQHLIAMLIVLIGTSLSLLISARSAPSADQVIINNTAVPPVPTVNSQTVARGLALYSQ
jgi:hypothetical protein